MSIKHQGMCEERERELNAEKYERIFIFTFLTTVLLIIGSAVAVWYIDAEYIKYLVVVNIVSIAIANDTQKAYKKFHIVK
ncbi:hypothetical protein P4I92_16570 [Bacillus cereus]